MMVKVKFVIATRSFVLNRGLSALLRDFRNVEVMEMVEDIKTLQSSLPSIKPDFVIISTELLMELNPLVYNQLYQASTNTAFIHLQTNPALIPEVQTQKMLPLNYTKAHTTLFFNRLFEPFLEQEKQSESEISDREKVILALVAKGKTNKEIADELNISIHTVVTHRKNITHKLGIKSISGLTVYAIFNGLITMDEVK
jgi:DNA-binding CsgD family transcriptional regulator